jgi:D-alanyl-D-alanine carboxypeptidase/D-alanyl-D-alanine-endopeptidase (penicillin-binding protein 4)
VAGFDGTLSKRYRQVPTSAAAGMIRAKTGTLDGVSALAGLVTTRTGGVLAFDVTADRVPSAGTLAAEAALDRVATALASCGCA